MYIVWLPIILASVVPVSKVHGFFTELESAPVYWHTTLNPSVNASRTSYAMPHDDNTFSGHVSLESNVEAVSRVVRCEISCECITCLSTLQGHRRWWILVFSWRKAAEGITSGSQQSTCICRVHCESSKKGCFMTTRLEDIELLTQHRRNLARIKLT